MKDKKNSEILEIITKKVIALGSLQDFTGLITWEAVFDDNWKSGQLIDLHGTFNIKVISTDYHMRFVTIIPPGKGFSPPHYHDFIEKCTVIRGVLFDPLSEVNISEGEVIAYDAMQPHEPQNISDTDCALFVDFVNTQDKREAEVFLENFNSF